MRAAPDRHGGRMRVAPVALALATCGVGVLLAGCGVQRSPEVVAGGSVSPSATLEGMTTSPGTGVGGPEELIGTGLVLEDASHGPQLCLGAIAASLPPQCGGTGLPNWDWNAVTGHTTRGQTTFGSYVVVGTYDPDADTFTLTRAPLPTQDYTGPSLDQSVAPVPRTPCPPPAGGWRVIDPATTTQEALQKTQSRASGMPGFAGLWVDQSHSSNPESNDPTQLVLNAAFTGDESSRAAGEADLRRSWGGALCVSHAAHTEADLTRIQRAVSGHSGLLSSGAESTGSGVQVTVIYDDGTWQAELDRTYGPGAVTVTSALRAYDGQLDATR